MVTFVAFLDTSKEVHQCCLTATFSLQLLMEHARIWGTLETQNVAFADLSSQLVDSVKRLADHVTTIIEVCMEEKLTAFVTLIFA